MKMKRLVSGVISAALLVTVSGTALAAGGRHCRTLASGIGTACRIGCHDFYSMVPRCTAPGECYGGKRGCVDENGDGICDNWQPVSLDWDDAEDNVVYDDWSDVSYDSTYDEQTSEDDIVYGGGNWVDNNNDGICDNYQDGNCYGGGNWVDDNNDGICDNYQDGNCYGGGYNGGGHHGGGHHGGGHRGGRW